MRTWNLTTNFEAVWGLYGLKSSMVLLQNQYFYIPWDYNESELTVIDQGNFNIVDNDLKFINTWELTSLWVSDDKRFFSNFELELLSTEIFDIFILYVVT